MKKISRRRGRPQGGRSYAVCRSLDYLARLSISKNLDSSDLFNSLVDAWMHKKSTCEKLVIRCRKKTQDSATFLFTIEQEVLAQLKMPKIILQKNNPIKDYIDSMSPEAFSVKKPIVKNPKIRDLEQRMKSVNIKARVIETPEPRRVWTRFGMEAYVSNVLIADETGTIRLCLWNQQINKVSVDDVIKIENAKVARFRGECQLKLGKSGKLNILEGEFFPTHL